MREIDPQVFGPGTWIVTHVLGLVSDESNDQQFYSLYIFRMVHALPCRKCRRHAVKYVDKFPVPTSKNEGSLFEWSVNFHNAVNKRLRKVLMTLDQAREIYRNTEVILSNESTKATCSLKVEDESCQDTPI
jgi:hypothetical protein